MIKTFLKWIISIAAVPCMLLLGVGIGWLLFIKIQKITLIALAIAGWLWAAADLKKEIFG